jgi:hypothetical protein
VKTVLQILKRDYHENVPLDLFAQIKVGLPSYIDIFAKFLGGVFLNSLTKVKSKCFIRIFYKKWHRRQTDVGKSAVGRSISPSLSYRPHFCLI